MEVSHSSVDTGNSSKTFVKASSDISGAVNEIEQGINQQAKDAESCLQQMDDLSNKIDIVSANTKIISKIAEDTKNSISEGTLVTIDLNEQTKVTTEIASEIIKEIGILAEKSTSISNIVSVINEISEQTSLLSLNATIEAARAGVYGRGFSVVAEEINKLSNQTRASVDEIQKNINNILKSTMNVTTTARKAENIMQLQEKAVENTTKSYQRIQQNVEGLVVNLNDILDSVVNIDQARISTLEAIENITAVLEEVSASTNAVNETAHDQLETVEQLNELADRLNTNSDQLVRTIATFMV